jgi:hypothetical protein
MVLAQIQSELAAIYATPLNYDIADFLITDAGLAATLTPEHASNNNQERLLVRGDPDALCLSLYIDDTILACLSADDPSALLHEGNFGAYLIALEGVSHLNYVIWHGERDHPVTLFELELQAEIDKYVACAKLFSAQQGGHIPPMLHQVLFDSTRYDSSLDATELQRYQDANYFAAKYCSGLRRRYPGHHGQPSFLKELRAFYRLTRNQKIQRIRAAH